MPNEHGQITEDDFRAPSGQFRLMMEDMQDGEVKIIADYHILCIAQETTRTLRETASENEIFTLWDDQGKEI